MKVFDAIKNRRSIRKYKNEKIDDAVINTILEAARWAPSGLNNQPWKFFVVKDSERKNSIAAFTRYSKIIKDASLCICVFLNKANSYHREKDIMAIGACIQNMMISAYEQNIGTCWLGEILNQAEKVSEFLGIDDVLELMAVITLGIPEKNSNEKVERKDLLDLMV